MPDDARFYGLLIFVHEARDLGNGEAGFREVRRYLPNRLDLSLSIERAGFGATQVPFISVSELLPEADPFPDGVRVGAHYLRDFIYVIASAEKRPRYLFPCFGLCLSKFGVISMTTRRVAV